MQQKWRVCLLFVYVSFVVSLTVHWFSYFLYAATGLEDSSVDDVSVLPLPFIWRTFVKFMFVLSILCVKHDYCVRTVVISDLLFCVNYNKITVVTIVMLRHHCCWYKYSLFIVYFMNSACIYYSPVGCQIYQNRRSTLWTVVEKKRKKMPARLHSVT